jgi:hypothetical protein
MLQYRLRYSLETLKLIIIACHVDFRLSRETVNQGGIVTKQLNQDVVPYEPQGEPQSVNRVSMHGCSCSQGACGLGCLAIIIIAVVLYLAFK